MVRVAVLVDWRLENTAATSELAAVLAAAGPATRATVQ